MSGLPQRTEHARVRLDQHLVLAEPITRERVTQFAGRDELPAVERTEVGLRLPIGGSLEGRSNARPRWRPSLIDHAVSRVPYLCGDRDIGPGAVEFDHADPKVGHVRDRAPITGPARTEWPRSVRGERRERSRLRAIQVGGPEDEPAGRALPPVGQPPAGGKLPRCARANARRRHRASRVDRRVDKRDRAHRDHAGGSDIRQKRHGVPHVINNR